MRHRKTTSSSLRCSFCHKPKDLVEQLLAGPGGVYICNDRVPLPHRQTKLGSEGLRDAE